MKLKRITLITADGFCLENDEKILPLTKLTPIEEPIIIEIHLLKEEKESLNLIEKKLKELRPEADAYSISRNPLIIIKHEPKLTIITESYAVQAYKVK